MTSAAGNALTLCLAFSTPVRPETAALAVRLGRADSADGEHFAEFPLDPHISRLSSAFSLVDDLVFRLKEPVVRAVVSFPGSGSAELPEATVAHINDHIRVRTVDHNHDVYCCSIHGTHAPLMHRGCMLR